jgi:hypothetical protein
MKILSTKILTLAIPLALSLLLGSCVSDGNPGYSHRGSGGGRYVTYTTLPSNYSGTSYFYKNRYYAGGRYETGRYVNGGRTYGNRYYHNGQYIYGGTYRNYPVARTVQPVRTVSPRANYRTYTTTPQRNSGSRYRYSRR